jgi:cytochrome b
MIVYRNPIDQWFWEGGYTTVAYIVLALIAISFVWGLIDRWKSDRAAKKRWQEMTPGQRQQWRYFNRRNNFLMEKWEKE